MSQIFVSTGAFRGGRLAEMAEACECMGAGLELSSGVRWHDGLQAEIDEVIASRRRLLIHNYFPPPREPFVLNLADELIDSRTQSMEHVHAALALSARCGAPFYSVHSGFCMNLEASDLGKPEAQAKLARVPYGRAAHNFFHSIKELARHARSLGVRLLIENNVLAREQAEGERPLLMTEPSEIAGFLRKLNEPNVGLLLDVGHAKVTAAALGIEPEAYFEELAPWIGAVHLSDNDGTRDNNRPFAADAWFARHLVRGVPVVVEVYNIGDDGARELVEIVRGWHR